MQLPDKTAARTAAVAVLSVTLGGIYATVNAGNTALALGLVPVALLGLYFLVASTIGLPPYQSKRPNLLIGYLEPERNSYPGYVLGDQTVYSVTVTNLGGVARFRAMVLPGATGLGKPESQTLELRWRGQDAAARELARDESATLDLIMASVHERYAGFIGPLGPHPQHVTEGDELRFTLAFRAEGESLSQEFTLAVDLRTKT